MKSFENVDNISFIEIAKKCIKYKKYDLAERFLKNEKSILVKIPQYLELGDWEKALELSLKSCDLNVIRVVIDKIYKVLEQRDFNEIFAKFPQAHSAVINYYKSIGKYDELEKYLNYQKDQEELLFISLENFFKSQTLEERKKYIDEAKKCLSGAKNIDYSFYKVYISDLANSLKVKEQCFDQDRNILEKNDITTFDNSMYDCFQKAKSKNYSWIESQNKKYFEISRRKMTILRFRTLLKEKLNGEKAEIDQIDQIDQIIKKEGYKRLDISPLKVANIFYEFLNSENIIKKNKEIIEMKATEYALLETNPDLYEDKFAFLMRMEKYIEAVQAALSNKKNEKMYTFINNVLKKKPELRTKIQELCDKNKVRL
jgi:DNA integrity scanning protein DisA with diadenylate cyclase activity